jgi:hypothetical protein
MKLLKTFQLIILSLIITSCANKKTIILDGHTYTQIRVGKTNDNGIIDIELWQRNEITNKYYTPSLNKKYMVPITK